MTVPPDSSMARRIGSRADYTLRCTVRAESFEATDVPCRIYLPEGKRGVPVVHLVPTERHYAWLTRTHELSLVGTLDRLSVESHVLYFIYATQRGFDPDHVDAFLVECEARDLRITERYSDKGSGDRSHVVFWLTPNPWLRPGKIRTSNLDGSVEMSQGELPTASLPHGITVTFDTHYESRSEGEEFIQRPHLVAEVNVDIAAAETERLASAILPDLDDLLLVVSLASRTRTICVGWTAADDASITKYFRGDRVVPTRTPTDSWYGLVPQQYRSEFLREAHARFLALSGRDAVRRAISASVPFHNSVFTETFLSRFAGIESLLLDFRRQTNLGKVMPSGRWKAFRQAVLDLIRQDDALSEDQVRWVEQKLPEINRVPLKAVLERFCEQYQLDLSAFWPVFGLDGEVGLAKIRHRLVHGEGLLEAVSSHAVIAAEHLKWVLEAMLITVLGWPLEKAAVLPERLRDETAMTEWRAAKAALEGIKR